MFLNEEDIPFEFVLSKVSNLYRIDSKIDLRYSNDEYSKMNDLPVRDGQYKPLKVLPHLGDQPENKVNYLVMILVIILKQTKK